MFITGIKIGQSLSFGDTKILIKGRLGRTIDLGVDCPKDFRVVKSKEPIPSDERIPGSYSREAVETIKRIKESGSKAFITSESCGPENHYQVVFKFQSLVDSQQFLRDMVACGETASRIESAEQEYRQ